MSVCNAGLEIEMVFSRREGGGDVLEWWYILLPGHDTLCAGGVKL